MRFMNFKRFAGSIRFTNCCVALTVALTFSSVWAAGGGGGGWAIGANIGFINSDQKDMNKEIEASSTTSGASQLGNAWEGNAHISYRMSGSSMALALRPSYFFYPEEKGTDAAYNLSGFTVFPMLKWYMLEDQNIKFYSQFGVGYGHLSGEIEVGSNSVKFSGGDIGYMAGLGAEFCFAGTHCLNVEGSLRFLSVDRFMSDSSTANALGGTSLIDQSGKGKELEISGRDFSATMSGILGMAGYTLYF